MIRLFVIIAFLAMAGCVSMQTQFAPSMVGQTYPVRTPADKIELFRSGVPTRKFVEIGAIHGCCSVDTNDMIQMMRQKASESGGDALVGLEIRASGSVVASVIRYTE